ncbi:LOW QUALITY PROTEIN: uncharacterized protein LOC126849726 [Cataglyphis hispanica]|uniref:LOW QUALITY PROTEIN: uncharacterized protein LOC126849726 n=1 Tax=Cataglyphis hispanica TaxID=1086592 RepID=UPI00217F652E|nr:LOW QUALITY PROTEIN: uncharacterized protein LOC126849726 [Cataglyphis hispanica]
MDHDSYYYASSYQDEDEDFDYGSKNKMSGDALLISLVRDHPYLYNKELTDFKDSLKKQNAWVEIASVMGMTVEDCQCRWMRLRERYSREKKQQQEKTTTGSGASKRKTFEFFDNMQFLERFVKRRKTMTNIYNMQNKSVSPLIGSSNLQKNFGSHDEKENISSSLNVATLNKLPLTKSIVDLTSDSAQHIGNDSLSSDLHLNVSGSSSTSAVSVSGYTRDKDLIGKRIKSKRKSHADVLENTIGKVISLLLLFIEDRCIPVFLLPSSLKPEMEEDMAFCQLILSLFINMPQYTKADKKKKCCVFYLIFNCYILYDILLFLYDI